MRRWLGWALFGGLLAANVAIGCGGGDATTSAGDDASAPQDSGGDGAIVGDDATTGQDAATGRDSTTGNDGTFISDAGLDIAFPDSFTVPDTSAPDASTTVEGGCAPNGVTCNGNVATTCNNGVTTVTTCSGAAPLCADGFGCVVCAPGSGSCNGSTGTVCKSDGSGYTTNVCDPLLGLTCAAGLCQGDCANIGQSYIGCEYYAVTMSNSQLDQVTFYYSISISNTGTQTASINITGPGFNQNDTIVAGGIKEYPLPWVPQLSKNGAAITQVVAGGAYHVRSTEPVTVYQFNARDYTRSGAFSYTNDASLLLPVNAMTGNYYAAAGATWQFFGNGQQFPGTVAIVGTVNGTSVTYAAPAGNPIIAGGGLGSGGGTVTINKGDVLQIQAAQNAPNSSTFGSDQSGGRITASQPVEVFGGSDCSFMPASVGYCDHLESSMFPVETLRSDYLIGVPYNSVGTPQHYVKIVGTQNGTTLTTDPPQAVPGSINAGQSVFFHTTQNFRVTSSAPILVAQFMEGEDNFQAGNTSAGDPSMSACVATAQFRRSYQFIAPPSYVQNWMNVIAPNGANVTVDGVAVAPGAAIGSSGYWIQKVALCAGGCAGVHTAAGNVPFGIMVYGYGNYTSYMYPGGLDLKRQ